jgi:hypothetical protein
MFFDVHLVHIDTFNQIFGRYLNDSLGNHCDDGNR